LAAEGEELSDADEQQTEGQKNLNWKAAEEDKMRDQQRVIDLQENMLKDRSSQQKM